MNRRNFLISTGIVAAFTSIPFMRRLSSPKPIVINNAYSLWYNRPAVSELSGGFCFGFITSEGEVRIAEISDQMLVRKVSTIHKFQVASDHGSPSLVRIPSGKYAGHVLACFSNHSSPLLCTRTARPEDCWEWNQPQVIDSGRATYASLAVLPNGKIVLMHTLQERIGRYDAGEWRRVVARVTDDGGETWSEPLLIAGFGAGTFPYSTPLSSSASGQCAMAYAVYSSVDKRHKGLTLVVTNDAFQSKTEISINLGEAATFDTIPYETRWISNTTVAVSYTQMSKDGSSGMSRAAFVNVESGQVLSNLRISEAAVHTYAGGATLSEDGRAAISSPPTGGLVRQDLETGVVTRLVESGSFSSPWLFTLHGKVMLTALRNPSIISTRKFSAEILIMPVV